MAETNSTHKLEIAPGVTIHVCFWGNVYEGRDEDLIAAKIIGPDCIPGKPGQRKTVAYMERAGRKIEARRKSKRKLSVREYFSEYDRESLRTYQQRRKQPSDSTREAGETEAEQWKRYASGVEVMSARKPSEDRCYRGWPQYLLDAGVIGEDLWEGGYAIYGDKRVYAEVCGKGWLLVHERVVDFERLPELSVAENEMIGMFRHCGHVGRCQLIQLARSFAELNKNIGDGNVIDFAAYRRKHGYAEAAE